MYDHGRSAALGGTHLARSVQLVREHVRNHCELHGVSQGDSGRSGSAGCDRKRRSPELLELVILVVELLFDYCLVGSSPDLQCGQCTIKRETYEKTMCSKVA